MILDYDKFILEKKDLAGLVTSSLEPKIKMVKPYLTV